MKKLLNFLGVSMLFALPVAFFSQWFDFDKVSALFFAITVAILLYIYRDRVAIQKIIFPFLYLILIRTKVGLKLMDKLADKFREFIKLLGLSFIGLGFLGMIYISIMFFRMMLMLVKAPLETSKGVALILPFTEVPGVGYLSFWYFIIGIFFIAVIHEFAHGVMARAHKLNVQSSGVGFFAAILPIIPIAFVEPNEKKLVKEKDHIQYSIFAAGPAINIIVAIIIAIILPYTAYGMLSLQEYAPFEEKITEPLGVSLISVEEYLPAFIAGIEPGTIINSINGTRIDNTEQFLTYMQST
ncbi:MAG: site-2 protease family protein, partial [Nanoarchaeota archaeon]|nr:site-2 protease family protein [Nanoarchaeota archaeon]